MAVAIVAFVVAATTAAGTRGTAFLGFLTVGIVVLIASLVLIRDRRKNNALDSLDGADNSARIACNLPTVLDAVKMLLGLAGKAFGHLHAESSRKGGSIKPAVLVCWRDATWLGVE